MGIDVGHYELMSHISEFLPQKEIVVTVILDSNDVREKISGCASSSSSSSSSKPKRFSQVSGMSTKGVSGTGAELEEVDPGMDHPHSTSFPFIGGLH